MPNLDNTLNILIAVSFIIYTIIVFALVFQVSRVNRKLKSFENNLLICASKSQLNEAVAKLDKGFIDALLLCEHNITHALDDLQSTLTRVQSINEKKSEVFASIGPQQNASDKISAAIEYARSGYDNAQIAQILKLKSDVVEEITKFNCSN